MEVILDELTPLEFFAHGGIVKITVCDDLANECDLKKKYTFFDYRNYSRFLRNLYISYIHLHNGDKNSFELYKYVNGCLELNPSIGESNYVVDLDYDKLKSYENARFYYSGDKRDSDISPRDPYGIKNVCFTLIDETDDRWEDFSEQRLQRGFDDSELWSLDGTIARFIYPRLKAFKESVPGTPGGMSLEQWNYILNKMVKGFELLSNDNIKSEDEEKLEKEAWKLFSEYFFDLWF